MLLPSVHVSFQEEHDGGNEGENSRTTNDEYSPLYELYWSQDLDYRVDCISTFKEYIPKESITIQGKGKTYSEYSCKDRHSAVGSSIMTSFPMLWNYIISNNTQELLVHDDLPHPIHYKERDDKYDDDNDDEMDWEIDHGKEGLIFLRLHVENARRLFLQRPTLMYFHGMSFMPESNWHPAAAEGRVQRPFFL
ncbi:hypothetical protein MHU86_19671 [Fragilaria crotonensis]|nr:hypothetical protein MHU86_19671 [Fragilaria crotonensis]